MLLTEPPPSLINKFTPPLPLIAVAVEAEFLEIKGGLEIAGGELATTFLTVEVCDLKSGTESQPLVKAAVLEEEEDDDGV